MALIDLPVPYPHPHKLSDPSHDFSAEHLHRLVSKPVNELEWHDFQAALGHMDLALILPPLLFPRVLVLHPKIVHPLRIFFLIPHFALGCVKALLDISDQVDRFVPFAGQFSECR